MDVVDKAESTVTTAVVDLAGELAEHLVDPAERRRPPRRRRRGARGAPEGRRHAQAGQPDARRSSACCGSGARCVPHPRALPRAQALARRDGLRRPDGARRADRQHGAAGGRRRAAALPGRAARRVPGHLRGPAPAAARALRRAGRAGAGHRGRRPAPVDLRLARRVARPRSTASATTSPTPSPPRAATCPRAGATTAPSSPPPTPWPTRSPRPPGCRSSRWPTAGCRPGPGRARPGSTTLEDEARARRRLGRAPARAARAAHGSGAVPQAVPVRPGRRGARGTPASRTRSSGLGGLLHTPEVADLVALLHVVQDPTRGDRLMRLLTGPSCRLGAADLDGLAEWSRLRQRARRGDRGADLVARRQRARQHRRGARRPPAGDVGRREGQRCRRRTRSGSRGSARPCGGCARSPGSACPSWSPRPRRRSASTSRCSRAPATRPVRRGPTSTPSPTSRATFAASADRPTLGGFLAWLEAAVDEERGLDLGWVEARPDAVQVMTVHAAKGLEWDVVAVPGLVESSFPAHSATQGKLVGDGWGHADPSDKGWLVGLATLPVRPARRPRGPAPVRLGRRTTTGTPRQRGLRGLHRGAGRPRHRRGAPARLRRGHPGAQRPAAHRARVGHGDARRGSPRASSTRCRDAGGSGSSLPARGSTCHRSTTPSRRTRAPPRRSASPGRPSTTSSGVSGCSSPARRVVAAGGRSRRRGAGRCRRRGPVGRRGPDAARRAGPPAQRGADVDVALPPHLSTSALVALAEDAERFTLDLRRPMPDPAGAGRAARHGVPRLGRGALLAGGVRRRRRPAGLGRRRRRRHRPRRPAGGLPGQRVGRPHAGRGRDERRDRGRRHRGARPDRRGVRGGRRRRRAGWVVVDWKTGAPASGARAAARALQLSAYRLAWARLRGVPEHRVRGAFFHAATGETLWPELPGADEITRGAGGRSSA